MKILKAIWYFLTKLKIIATVVFILLASLMFMIADNYDNFTCEIIGYICLLYPAGFMIAALIYAWIINPIREYKRNKK